MLQAVLLCVAMTQLLAAGASKGSEETGVEMVRTRRGVNDPRLWPAGTIPFVFEEPFSRRHKRQVMKAIGVWEAKTCIKFVDQTNEEYFALFTSSGFSCISSIGRQEYPIFQNRGQPVNLTESCLKRRGNIIHELGHLIGLYHEHQRPDRDDYIQINYANIIPVLVNLFTKYDFTTYGPYDFGSIMHYRLDTFAMGNTTSMQVLPNVTVPEGVQIGHLHTASKQDAKKVKLMYQCPKKNKQLPKVEEISSDNVYTGEELALAVTGSVGGNAFPSNSWLSCTLLGCTISNCPGRLFRANDRDQCPYNVFTLHKLSSASAGALVRVGDSVVLEHRILQPDKPVIQSLSHFVTCDKSTLKCALSLECSASLHEFNITSSCMENTLTVRAEGKEVGTPITHKDLVGFEYQPSTSTSLPCAFECNPITETCRKEVCSPSNSLDFDPTSEAPCAKNIFRIHIF